MKVFLCKSNEPDAIYIFAYLPPVSMELFFFLREQLERMKHRKSKLAAVCLGVVYNMNICCCDDVI